MRKKLFMIEDEPLLCELFGEYASILDEVEYLGDARDGVSAIAKCEELKPDIVILDIRIPELNGLDILSRLSQLLPDSQIIVFTGSLSEETLRTCIQLDAAGYIEKSYGLEELQKAIEAALEGNKHFSPGVKALMKNYQF